MSAKKQTGNSSKNGQKSGGEFAGILHFELDDPFKVLGPKINPEGRGLTIAAFLPFAETAHVKIKGRRKLIEMKKLTEEGIFRAEINDLESVPEYKFICRNKNSEQTAINDPYAFTPELGEIDLHLLGEGNHFKSYEKLGSRPLSLRSVKGVNFILWAPNAKAVSVAGDFNDWMPGAHPMCRIQKSGYWGLFIPGLKEGALYKYAVKSRTNHITMKTDPYAFMTELRPGNASVVKLLKGYKWGDKEWMKSRKKSASSMKNLGRKPVTIYEVHLGSWKKDYENDEFPNEWGYKNYRQLAHELVDYAKEMNYTHLELLPVMEHPLDISWGYQVVNYFAPTSRYGTPEDFMYFVDYCHQNGVGVILDWVPSHFPTDAHGLGEFDGKRIYEYADLKKGYHKDWGTYIFDYGRNEVSNFLISNALFWMDKYHVDGLRVDAVASMLYLDYSREAGEWEPNIYGGNENLEAIAFLKKLNDTIHSKFNGVMTIAEESSSWPGVTLPVHLGGLGFDMKWNMGWMHDILAYFSMDPIFRKFHHGKLTFAIWYAFNEKFVLPLSHDEVVHLKKSVVEKMPGDAWHKFANLRLLYGFMFGHPGKKLNFMTNDIAQFREWNSEAEMDWEVLDSEENRKLHDFFRELNRIYVEEPALHEDDFDSTGFQWVDFSNSDESIISFVRYNLDRSKMLLFTFNMTPVVRKNYVLGVPSKGFYREILNSDSEKFGGSNEGNLGGVYSEEIPRFEFPHSVKLTLPPLAVNIYLYEKEELSENSSSSVAENTVYATSSAAADNQKDSVSEAVNINSPTESDDTAKETIDEEDVMSGQIKDILKRIREGSNDEDKSD